MILVKCRKEVSGSHNFVVEQDGIRSVAKPLFYIYRNKSEKIDVRYTADGKLESSKGIEKNNQSNG